MDFPIGKNIKQLRRKNHLTQRALAYQLGVSEQAVSKWETGKSYPDLFLLPAIAGIFEIRIDELFYREAS
jgi:transcriptional regulator with XRE-family HTH domain